MFDHFVWLVIKGLNIFHWEESNVTSVLLVINQSDLKTWPTIKLSFRESKGYLNRPRHGAICSCPMKTLFFHIYRSIMPNFGGNVTTFKLHVSLLIHALITRKLFYSVLIFETGQHAWWDQWTKTGYRDLISLPGLRHSNLTQILLLLEVINIAIVKFMNIVVFHWVQIQMQLSEAAIQRCS